LGGFGQTMTNKKGYIEIVGDLFPDPSSTPPPFILQRSDQPNEAMVTQTVGTLRSNYSDYVGMHFIVKAGAGNKIIEKLGRWKVSGNPAKHTMRPYDGSGNILGETVVDTTQGAAGDYVYAALPRPVTVYDGSGYYVLSLEANGGDQWYDDNTAVTPNADFTVDH